MHRNQDDKTILYGRRKIDWVAEFSAKASKQKKGKKKRLNSIHMRD